MHSDNLSEKNWEVLTDWQPQWQSYVPGLAVHPDQLLPHEHEGHCSHTHRVIYNRLNKMCKTVHPWKAADDMCCTHRCTNQTPPPTPIVRCQQPGRISRDHCKTPEEGTLAWVMDTQEEWRLTWWMFMNHTAKYFGGEFGITLKILSVEPCHHQCHLS